MARYRPVDRSPKFIPVVLDAQIQPDSFEYALDYLVDHEIDLSALHVRYSNDATGAPAYNPAVLLKIVLLANSRGLISSRMKHAIDSPKGRRLYGQRMATVEPVFANLRHNKLLDRFTLRGQAKVNTQWMLYCLVHNVEKLAHHGFAQEE